MANVRLGNSYKSSSLDSSKGLSRRVGSSSAELPRAGYSSESPAMVDLISFGPTKHLHSTLSCSIPGSAPCRIRMFRTLPRAHVRAVATLIYPFHSEASSDSDSESESSSDAFRSHLLPLRFSRADNNLPWAWCVISWFTLAPCLSNSLTIVSWPRLAASARAV